MENNFSAAGQYNDLATPFMSMPGDTIRYIFSVEGGSKGRQDYMVCNETSACHFTPRSLGLLSGIYLLLMALASGVAVPGGLFMPSIMVRPCLSFAPNLCLSFVAHGPCQWSGCPWGALHAFYHGLALPFVWAKPVPFDCPKPVPFTVTRALPPVHAYYAASLALCLCLSK